MKLVRTIFIALAVLLPTTWTVAKAAGDTAGEASGEGGAKKEKKAKKSKKAEGAEGDKKADDKAK